ncbi:hypothetical protein NE237_005554 [Protea cynaroides]|uniref:DUF627 domain-containing protein n=1 Tax=Protea cynaroides TaxID=273540 RepID=A0A9Q0GLI7_9MAGN|nr:hypothetical protein NE237_005554 [Protea cynaroides]
MGHKKRNPASSSKLSAATPEVPSDGVAVADGCLGLVEEDRSHNIALNALRRRNHFKALRLLKESCQSHEGSALIHRIQGTICVKVASLIEDPNAKQRYFKNAVESARLAVVHSPNSIKFSHFYTSSPPQGTTVLSPSVSYFHGLDFINK